MTEPRHDEPIEEIRELRRQISERFENDPDKLVAHYLQLQKQYADRLVKAANQTARKDPSAA